MKQIIFEFQKIICKKYVIIFGILFFIINILFAIYTSNKIKEQQIPSNIVTSIFNIYINEPKRIEKEYEYLNELINQQDIIFQDAIRLHEFNYEPKPLTNKYTSSDKYDDIALFKEIFVRKKYINDYPLIIDKIIYRANLNLAEFDFSKVKHESYVYKYQLKVIDLYEKAQSNIKMKLEYTRGWSDYFNYNAVNIFIFAILLLIGSVVFTQEKTSGFIFIIRASKNGRINIALIKIATMLLATATIVLLFTLSTWVVFGVMLGYSDPSNAIQVFKDFTFTPYIINVGQYFAITVAFKVLVFTLFSCIILLISVFLYNYALIYILGFSLFGLNFLLYTLRYFNTINIFKNFNLIAVATVNPLFEKYQSINFFGFVCGHVPFIVVVFSMLLIITCIITAVIYSRGQNYFNVKHHITINNSIYKIRMFIIYIKNRVFSFLPKKQIYSNSLVIAEIYKTLISKRYIWIVIGLLLVKGCISNSQFEPVRLYADDVYKEYMEVLEGELTDEKRVYINNERLYINNTLSKEKVMRNKYISEEITFEEYLSYLNEYNYAYLRNDIFFKVEEHRSYIEQIKMQKDINVWFIYDTGWKTFFHNNFDITLYIIIILLTSGVFADEYMTKSSLGSFAQILRTTMYGRKRTFTAKCVATVILTFIFTFICNLIDISLIYINYDLPSKNAPLLSLHSFYSINNNTTLSQYLIIYIIIKFVGYILLALFVCGLSGVIMKTITVVSTTIAVTLFPAIFKNFGFAFFHMADFTGLLAVTPLYLLSTQMIIIYLFIIIIFVTSINVWSYRIYIK